ncbi:MAG: PAS domain S-box protein [Ignavibacteria bacterium]|nr:PAS domain S-box protein [Ignavibacteria bacterium]
MFTILYIDSVKVMDQNKNNSKFFLKYYDLIRKQADDEIGIPGEIGKVIFDRLMKYLLIFGIFLCIGGMTFFVRKTETFLLAGVLFLFMGFAKILADSGRLRLGAITICSFIFIISTVMIALSGGLRSPYQFFYLVCILFSGLLIGQVGLIVTAALIVIVNSIFCYILLSGFHLHVYFPLPPLVLISLSVLVTTFVTMILKITFDYLADHIKKAKNEMQERLLTEASLRQKNKDIADLTERYKSFITLSNTGAWEFNADTNFLWCSPEYFSILGRSIDDFDMSGAANIKEAWYSLLHPDDLQRCSFYFHQYIESPGGKLYEDSFRMRHATGGWVWILTRGQALRDASGLVTRKIIGTHTDITQQKQSEQTLIERNLFVYNLTAQSPDIIYIYDLHSDTNLYINKDIGTLLGYKKGELPADSMNAIRQLLHPDDISQFDNYIPKVQDLQDNYVLEFEYRLLAKDHTWRWFYGKEKAFERRDGKIVTLIGTVRDVTERKESEIELLIYQLGIENSVDALFLVNNIGKILRVSQSAGRLLGYSKNDLLKLSITDINPNITKLDWKNLWDALKISKSRRIESSHKSRTGKIFPVEIMLSYVEFGKDCYCLLIARDITERKLVEERLRTNERRLSYAIAATSDCIWEWNLVTSQMYFSPRWYESLGYMPNEFPMILPTWKNLCHPDDWQPMIEAMKPTFLNSERGYEIEIRMLAKNGTWRWILSRGNVVERDSNGTPVLLSGTNSDITDKRIAEQAIRESEERFAKAFNNSAVAIGITTASEGRYTLVNEEFLNLSQYSRDEVIGRTSTDLQIWLNNAERDLFLQKLREANTVRNLEMNFRSRNGEVLTGLFSADMIMIKGVQHLLFTFLDITDRKYMEQELIVAKNKAEEANRLKSSFLANMSHELRTPMIGILGYSEILHEIAADAELQRISGLIFRSGKRLMETLNHILDLSRIEAGKHDLYITHFDAHALLRDICNLFSSAAEKKKLQISLTSHFGDTGIECDEKMFREVFYNLINNAIKFTESGGITVSIAREQFDNNDFFTFKVSDTGIGISRQDQGIIFEEFRQASEGIGRGFEGTGLGLTLTKRFVEKLGGFISVESEPGKGSTFIVSLPVHCSK